MSITVTQRRPHRSAGAGVSPAWFVMAILVTMLAQPPMLHGQDTLPRVELGARIRLEPTSSHLQSTSGRVVLSTPDSIGIQRSNELLYVSRQDLMRVKRREGRSHAKGALKGASWGALATAGLVILGAVQDAGGPAEGQIVSAAAAGLVGGVVVVIPVTTLIGALVGSDQWTTIWEAPSSTDERR